MSSGLTQRPKTLTLEGMDAGKEGGRVERGGGRGKGGNGKGERWKVEGIHFVPIFLF